MHMGGGAHMGGSPGAAAGIAARSGGPAASFARGSAPAGVAAASPNVGARGTFAGNRAGWNGGNWHGGNWRGGHYRHGHFYPGAFAAGALVGGALAANAYDPYYYGGYGPDYYYETAPEVAVVPGGSADASYCAQRFKSWDPNTGTYLGYDGKRHPCP